MKYKEADIDTLVPAFRARVETLLTRMRERGFTPCLRSAYRTRAKAQQNATKGTGIADSMHCYGIAADIICGLRGWKHPEFFAALGEEAKALGLVWGGEWKRRDMPHVQAVPVRAQNEVRTSPPHFVNAVADRYLALVAALLLAACMRPPAELPMRTSDDVRVSAVSEHGWRMAGLPEPGACLSRFHITWAADEAELARLCGPRSMQCLLGARVVLAPSSPPKAAIHEAMHALYYCRLRTVDLYDYDHTDPRVWVDYPRDNPGGADSAQGRARRAYDGSL